MAAREIRAAPRRLLLLTASVAIGVAALVAIDSFTDNLRDSVRGQARALLGADLSLSSRRPFTPAAEAVLDSLARTRGRGRPADELLGDGLRAAHQRHAAGAGGRGRGGLSALWRDPHRPRRRPGASCPRAAASWWTRRSSPRSTPAWATRSRWARRASSSPASSPARPNNVGVRTAFGPRIYIPARDLGATELLGFGARAEYEAFVRLPAGSPRGDGAALPPGARSRARPGPDRGRRPARHERRAGHGSRAISDLVALIALLLGGIGVASAVVVFIRQRLDTIAVLRCLGATAGPRVRRSTPSRPRRWDWAAASPARCWACWRSGCCPACSAGLLPVQVEPVVLPARACCSAWAWGCGWRWCSRLMPLLAVRRVPPLAALRRDVEPERRRLDPWRLAAAAALAASTVALAALQVGSWRQGAIFSGAVGVALLVLWVASWALIRAARRWLPGGWPYVWRQGLANLHRPVEPDGDGGARHRIRRLPAGHAVPGAVQPAPDRSG